MNKLRKDEIHFTVSARTARLIGQENFANAEGAIIELVKNSYDADSSVSIILLNSVSNSLFIIDNGEGMTSDIIRKHWMTIGTDDKKNNFRSKKDRIRTGAKGIGRFALDRLGSKCRMLSKTINDECQLWEVDWSQFDEKDLIISDIKAHLIQLNDFNMAHEIEGILKSHDIGLEISEHWKNNSGTIIEISDLRDQWDEKSMISLFTSLEILIPPLEANIFSVYAYYAQEPHILGQVVSAHCDDFDYKLSANVNEDQSVKINVFRNELNVQELIRYGFFENSKLNELHYKKEAFEKGSFTIETDLKRLLAGFSSVDKYNYLSKIGPFSFSFYFLKRGGGQEKDEEIGKYPYKNVNYSSRAKWLNRFGGIKIFRDNFRVRPYGEIRSSSYDWLDLGKRALSNPTVTRPGYRVKPQQVYGILNISRIGNINFEDKSSREGLQENDVFNLFKEVIISIIEIFENDRNQIMMSLKKLYDERNQKEKAKRDAEETIEKKQKEKTTQEEKVYIDAITAYREEIDDLKDEQKLLRVLASAGLIVTSFAHELKNLSDVIIPRTEEFKNSLKEIIDDSVIQSLPDYLNPFIMIDDMQKQDIRLKTWLDFSLASVRKDKRSRKTINLVEYIKGLERTWSSLLSRRLVILKIDPLNFKEVYFKGYEIDLDSIFNNLIANSIDAFKRPDAGDVREIQLSFIFNPLDGKGISVLYNDTGPGLEDEIIDPNQIFQPFFTTKRDNRTGERIGTGLGMWIIKSIIDEYNGDIEILSPRPEFKLRFVLPSQ